MKLMQILLLIFCCSILVGCAGKQNIQTASEEDEQTVKPLESNSSGSEILTSTNDTLVENFVEIYVTQELDSKAIDKKASELKNYFLESSVYESVLMDLNDLKMQVEAYQVKKEINTSSTVRLVNKKVDSIQVYKKGALYLIDVKYVETSPLYEGEFEQRIQFTCKVEDSKIKNFEELR